MGGCDPVGVFPCGPAPDRDRETLAEAEAQELLERGVRLLGDPNAGRYVVTDRSTPEGLAVMRMTLLNMDPPKHNRYRRLVNRGFTPKMIRQKEADIRNVVTELIDDVIEEIRKRAEIGQRTLVTTLTKKTAEDLSEYLRNVGLRVKYLHSEIDAIERVEILRGLRKADFDCLVLGQVRQVLHLQAAVRILVDGDRVDHAHRAAIVQPLQFGDHLAVEIGVTEPQHDELHRSYSHIRSFPSAGGPLPP